MSLVSDYDLCFFMQKTAYEMRISDWSSDVCSSDLLAELAGGYRPTALRTSTAHVREDLTPKMLDPLNHHGDSLPHAYAQADQGETSVDSMQLAASRKRQTRTRGAKLMTDSDCPAIRIDARVVEIDSQALQARQHLSGERLVALARKSTRKNTSQ